MHPTLWLLNRYAEWLEIENRAIVSALEDAKQ